MASRAVNWSKRAMAICTAWLPGSGGLGRSSDGRSGGPWSGAGGGEVLAVAVGRRPGRSPERPVEGGGAGEAAAAGDDGHRGRAGGQLALGRLDPQRLDVGRRRGAQLLAEAAG